MNGVDLARFEFDYDTTWQAFFLDRDLNIYSRYGGRDEKSADGRQSKESLLVTIREVLDVHARRQARAATVISSPLRGMARVGAGSRETHTPPPQPSPPRGEGASRNGRSRNLRHHPETRRLQLPP